MRNVLAVLVMTMISSVALAEVYVPYGQWTDLEYCGGQTRLICDDVKNARTKNRCYVEFRDVRDCNRLELYPYSYAPFYTSFDRDFDRFYVDNSKVSYSGTFRGNMTSTYRNDYENITYQFSY